MSSIKILRNLNLGLVSRHGNTNASKKDVLTQTQRGHGNDSTSAKQKPQLDLHAGVRRPTQKDAAYTKTTTSGSQSVSVTLAT